MIKATTVKAIFQRKHSLNFVGLDHRQQEVTNRKRLFTFSDPLARKVIGHRKEAAEVIGRMPPFRGKPGVVIVEPAHHCTDVESGLNGVQFVRGARNPRATLHCGPGNDRTEHFDAGRVIERQQPAAKRIHETQASGIRCVVAGNSIQIQNIVRNLLQDRVRFRTPGAGRVVARHILGVIGLDGVGPVADD